MKRKERHRVMSDYLNHYDSTNWPGSFMTALNESEIKKHSKCKNILHRSELNDVVKKINNKKKVIFLDFDGTLAPIVDDPEKANISVKTKGLIKKISSSPHNTLVIVSGRPHEFLQKKFKDINCIWL